MSLLEMQRALARLLTDEEFRESFFAAPGGAFAGYELSIRERASLLAIDRKRVAIHSHLVMHGRVETALAAFPLGARLIRPHLDELAPEFCRRYPPVATLEPTVQAEVRRFFAFLLEEQAAKRRWPAYFEDLLRHEECLFRLSHTAIASSSCEHAWRMNVASSTSSTLDRAESALEPAMGECAGSALEPAMGECAGSTLEPAMGECAGSALEPAMTAGAAGDCEATVEQ